MSTFCVSAQPMENQEYISSQVIQKMKAPSPLSKAHDNLQIQSYNSTENSDEIKRINATTISEEIAVLTTILSTSGVLWLQFTDFNLQCGTQHLYIYVGKPENRTLLSG